MNRSLLILVLVLKGSWSSGQETDSIPKNNGGYSHSVSFGLILPVDEFSETHIGGISAGYAWSAQRFGILERIPSRFIGFTADGGIDYFLGKKEYVAGNDFRYGNYANVHAFGGIMFNPGTNGNIRLTAGPVMGIYMGNTELGLGAQLDGAYYFSKRIGVMPGFIVFKNKEANAQWSAFLRASVLFPW